MSQNPKDEFQIALENLSEPDLYYLLKYLSETDTNNNAADLIFEELIRRNPDSEIEKDNYALFQHCLEYPTMDWRNCWKVPDSKKFTPDLVNPLVRHIVTLLNFC